jgi:hypothetical protein
LDKYRSCYKILKNEIDDGKIHAISFEFIE